MSGFGQRKNGGMNGRKLSEHNDHGDIFTL